MNHHCMWFDNPNKMLTCVFENEEVLNTHLDSRRICKTLNSLVQNVLMDSVFFVAISEWIWGELEENKGSVEHYFKFWCKVPLAMEPRLYIIVPDRYIFSRHRSLYEIFQSVLWFCLYLAQKEHYFQDNSVYLRVNMSICPQID